MNTPKFRKSINPNQLQILQLLFKFRYISSPLLATITNKSRQSVQQTFQRLEEQDFVGKKYNSSFRLQGKQAIYYLRPKAIRELKQRYNFNQSALNVMARNASLSETFMEHHLEVIKAYLRLKNDYSSEFHIFSQYELASFDYFMRPLPDLYLHRIKQHKNLPTDYVISIFSDKPTFVIKKQLETYWRHCDTNTWQSETKSQYPSILICCSNPRTESTIQSYSERLIDRTGGDELNILTTTTKALLSEEPTVWSDVLQPDKTIKLI